MHPAKLNRKQRRRLSRIVGNMLWGVTLPLHAAFWLLSAYTQWYDADALHQYLSGKRHHWRTEGFTLIELSIVLVIIGLLIGGVLVGQDSIRAAQTRAQITQIERYNSAVNAFVTKYGGVPGDLAANLATQFGFHVGNSCDGSPGKRDGNGLIEGSGVGYPLNQTVQETGLFWGDLSTANLVDGGYLLAGLGLGACDGSSSTLVSTPGITYVGNAFPSGKIGYGTFIYPYTSMGFNWFGLSAVTGVAFGGPKLQCGYTRYSGS